MLRQHSNALLQGILQSGLAPELFHREENDDDNEHPGLTIFLNEGDLWFRVRNPLGHFEQFDYQFVSFTAGFPWSDTIPDSGYLGFDDVLAAFKGWLATDVRGYLEDRSLPDLWTQVNEAREMLSPHSQPRKDETFTEDEKAQIQIAVEQFKILINKSFAPSPHEQVVVAKQLQRLLDSAERLDKFDWQGVALNTIISIGITLSLDTEKGRILFGLFQQAFSYALHLLK